LGRIFTCGIWNVLACGSRTTGAMYKQRLPLDSAHQEGPEIPFHGILMLVGGCCIGGEISLGGIFTCGIFNLFACNSTAKGVIVTWRPWLDLAGQKSPEISLEGVLILVKGGFMAERNGSGLTKSQCLWLLPF